MRQIGRSQPTATGPGKPESGILNIPILTKLPDELYLNTILIMEIKFRNMKKADV